MITSFGFLIISFENHNCWYFSLNSSCSIQCQRFAISFRHRSSLSHYYIVDLLLKNQIKYAERRWANGKNMPGWNRIKLRDLEKLSQRFRMDIHSFRSIVRFIQIEEPTSSSDFAVAGPHGSAIFSRNSTSINYSWDGVFCRAIRGNWNFMGPDKETWRISLTYCLGATKQKVFALCFLDVTHCTRMIQEVVCWKSYMLSIRKRVTCLWTIRFFIIRNNQSKLFE